MFFLISKILSFLINPITWIIILLIFALIIKRTKKKKIFTILALCFTIFFTNAFIAKEFMILWEYKQVSAKDIKQHYDAIIVLGGGIVTADKNEKNLIFRKSTDRLMQALWLYNNGVADKLLFSGGSGALDSPNMLEGKLLARYLIEIGYNKNDILVDSLSKNTRENAIFSAKILNDSIPNGKFLLITSSYHAKRSLACFKKTNLNIDIFPVEQISGYRNWHWMNLLMPQTDALIIWNCLIHEIIGYVSYKIVGYI